MSAAVSFTGVSRSFGRTRALADVSFQVPENSVCALLGPNGAGKTTAIRALLGLARTDAGEISVLGERPGSLAARSRLGYLPDVPAFPAWMTAREYLEASARLAGVPASTAGRRIDALLETAGLSSVRQRIGGYSRGMRQRLGIAQALIGAPGLLVLDEPTSALDPAGHREVLELIERLSGRTTVLLSSHNLAEADRVATHAVVLRAGRVLASSPVADLRRRAGALSLTRTPTRTRSWPASRGARACAARAGTSSSWSATKTQPPTRSRRSPPNAPGASGPSSPWSEAWKTCSWP